MLIDLKQRLDEPEIRELLAFAMFPDADRIDATIARYQTDEQIRVWGYESDGDVIGIIGYKMVSDGELEIVNIAVSIDERGHGYGRGIILEAIQLERPKIVYAETDEEAADFYRNIGFTVESLGEKYPGIERFKCTFETDF